ncbi:MAG: Smr/MutS family protein [Robiginitomaculum sp.]
MAKSGNGGKKYLTDADLEVWQRVSRTVSAYDNSPQKIITKPAAPFANKPKPLRPMISSRPVMRGSIGVKPAPQISKDKRTRRGKIAIDRKIDLHDMTQDEAYGALHRALYRAKGGGQRCVLVVTGKGGLSHRGVLRRMFPIWLSAPDIRPLIASYAPAHQRHGGMGAWYVFIKR